MSGHTQRHPIKASRLLASYRAPRMPFDSDYGSYAGHPDDPRNPTEQCPGCEGNRYSPEGEKCDFCNGQGWTFADE